MVHEPEVHEVGEALVTVVESEHCCEFVSDALRADDRQPLRLVSDRVVKAGSGLKAELPTEANCAKHPQRIVVEGLGWVARRAQNLVSQVALAIAERVDQLS